MHFLFDFLIGFLIGSTSISSVDIQPVNFLVETEVKRLGKRVLLLMRNSLGLTRHEPVTIIFIEARTKFKG